MKNFIFLFILFAIFACGKEPKANSDYIESKCMDLLKKSEHQIDSLNTVINTYQENFQRLDIYGSADFNLTNKPVNNSNNIVEKKSVNNNLNLPAKNCHPYIYVGCRGGKYMICISNKTGKEYKNYSLSKKDLDSYPVIDNCKNKN